MQSVPTSTADSGGFRETLKHHDFRRLWLGQIVSSTGDRFYQFALLHLALGSSSNFVGAVGRDSARVIFCGMILPVLLSRWIGKQVDRRDRRKILFWAEAVRGVIAVCILTAWLVGLPFQALLVFVACSGLMTGLFIPARQAALPMLVPTEHLVRGNALMTFAGIAANLAGATAGLAVALLGESFSFVAAALGFAFSSVMIARIRVPLLPPPRAEHQAETDELSPWGTRSAVRMLVWLTVAFTFVTGLFLPFVAEHVAVVIDASWLKAWMSRPQDVAFAGLILLLGVTGAGLFAGMLTSGRLPRLAHWRLLPVVMLAAWGLAIMKLGGTSAYAAAAALCFAAGWAMGLITIAADARLQHEVRGGNHGKVFARRLALSNIAFLSGLAVNLNGKLLHTYGSDTLLRVLGGCAIVLAALFYFAGKKSLQGAWGRETLDTVNDFSAHRSAS
jgi:MFS family permease